MHDEGFRPFATIFQSPEALHLFVIGIEFSRFLAGVQEASFLFLFPGFRYINIKVWRKLLGLLTSHDFKINERILLAASVPSLERQQRGRAMVAMRIYWPMGKGDIRLESIQEFFERFDSGHW